MDKEPFHLVRSFSTHTRGIKAFDMLKKQKNIQFLALQIKNLFITKNLGIFISKNFDFKNFKHFDVKNRKNKKSKKFIRFYVAISHGLLHFESIKIPSGLSHKKALSAARLEALRLLRLLYPEARSFCLSLFPTGRAEALVSAIDENIFRNILQNLSPYGLVAGFFPAWVALWAYLRKMRSSLPVEGLFYVKSGDGYEGFWLERGRPRGVIPFSPATAEKFFSLYRGPIEEIPGSPEDILSKGAELVPEVFPPEEVPVFEGYPLLLKPRIPARLLLLWLVPLFFFGSSFFLERIESSLEKELYIVEKNLSAAKEELSRYETLQREIALREELKKDLAPYLPGGRPPLLKALLELTLSFPEEAWIRRFEFRAPDQLRIWGEASNALLVVEALNRNPLFREVKFLSTVTRNPSTGKEVFSIQITLNLKTPS